MFRIVQDVEASKQLRRTKQSYCSYCSVVQSTVSGCPAALLTGNKPEELQKPLQLRGVIAHHINDLPGARLRPPLRRYGEGLLVDEEGDGGADEDG